MDHIASDSTKRAAITDKDRNLLAFVKILTLEPAKMQDEDVEKLRKVGWTDPEIFEAAFITSLFAFLNRMADAYGLDYRKDRYVPIEMRKGSTGKPQILLPPPK